MKSNKLAGKISVIDDIRADENIQDEFDGIRYIHYIIPTEPMPDKKKFSSGARVNPAKWTCCCRDNHTNPEQPAYDDLCKHFVNYLVEYQKDNLDKFTYLLLKNRMRFGKELLYTPHGIEGIVLGKRENSDWISVYNKLNGRYSFAYDVRHKNWFMGIKPELAAEIEEYVAV